MKIDHNFVAQPMTPADHLNNVFFQAENVEGWLMNGHPDAALIKAECHARSAQGLVDTLKKISEDAK